MARDFTKSPLNYPQGAPTPVRRVEVNRAPTTGDYKNFVPGDEWLDSNSKDWWKFIEKNQSGALWVKIGGTSSAAETFAVDATSGSGTNPVVPNALNEITMTGSLAASGTNPLRAVSSASNTIDYQIQTSQAVPATNASNSGICHFDDSQFTVDGNGFVQLNNVFTDRFSAYLLTSQVNQTGAGTVADLICDTEFYDTANEYNTTTGVFTASKDGFIIFSINVTLANLSAIDTGCTISINVGSIIYPLHRVNVATVRNPNGRYTYVGNLQVFMNSSETAKVTIQVTGNSTDDVVFAGADPTVSSVFCLFSGARFNI